MCGIKKKLELSKESSYTDRMKNKNNKNEKIETLKERFKVGEVLKVIERFHDGRGGYESIPHYITITKVNRVTVEGTEGKGGEMILDLNDLFHAKKVIQREILA
jgi:hypothetical protein